jgi:hypothetical protein
LRGEGSIECPKIGMHSLMLKGRVSSNNLIKFGLSQFTGGVVYGVHDLSPESIGRAA